MARKLTKRQINFLDQLYVAHKVTSWDDIPATDRKHLEMMNDYETLWSDAQRWLMDRSFKERRPK